MDEDTVYDLLEEIRKNADEALGLIWEITKDKDLWRKCLRLLSHDLDSSTHHGVDEGVSALYEELGIEFCEECGERIDACTCEDEEAETDEVEAQA